MRLVWTLRALKDREAIFDHVASQNPGAAIDLNEEFAKHAEALLATSGIGRPGRLKGTRELVVHRHYILVYKLTGGELRVIRVIHTARQWPPHK